MTPAQVRARLAKRYRGKAEPVRLACSPGCPGWRVVDTTRGNARLVACAECNALVPERLRVDDKMVRSLSEADRAWRDRNRELTREKAARKAARKHVHLARDREWSVCRQRIRKRAQTTWGTGWEIVREFREVPAYQHDKAIDWKATPQPWGVSCPRCLQWLRWTPEERTMHEAAAQAEEDAKLAALQERSAAKRQAERAALLAEIEEARPEALACLDAIEDGSIKRPENQVTLQRALNAALRARQRETKKYGKSRLWITRNPARKDETPAAIHDIHCRFCDLVLARDQLAGSLADTAFSEHTQPCALRYLARDFLPAPNPEIETDDNNDTRTT